MTRFRFLRNVSLGIKSLMLHKLRSLLTMLGVVFGVGSVVAMLSVGEGASQKALAEIERLGSRNIIIQSAKPTDEAQQSQNQQRSFELRYGLLREDQERIEQTFPAVRRTVPAKLIPRPARLYGNTFDVRMVGTTPGWFELVPRELVAGRVLSEEDVTQRKAVCVLAEQAARRLLATEHTIGQTLRIGGDSYMVVGILRNQESAGEGGSGVQTPDRANDAYVPITTVRERVGDTVTQRASGQFSRETVELHQIIVEVGETAYRSALDNVEPTAAGIRAMLERFHDKKDYLISVPLALLNQAKATQRIFRNVLVSIAAISLLVGGIGIMNIMLASVTERTREIGVRRAIGAKRRQIVGQFLIETVVLSVTGGIVGVLIGVVVIPFIINQYAQDMPTVVTAWSVLLSLGVSAVVGIAFGMYPAYRAAMLDPIIALRHE